LCRRLAEHGVASDTPLDSVVITRMKQFSGMTKVSKAAVMVAARHLNHEEIHGLKELFRSMFDTDGDGLITVDELRQGLCMQREGAAVSEDELAAFMRETDVDGSGTIDYNEFVAATVSLALLRREEVRMGGGQFGA